jgi:hypothetical protein
MFNHPKMIQADTVHCSRRWAGRYATYSTHIMKTGALPCVVESSESQYNSPVEYRGTTYYYIASTSNVPGVAGSTLVVSPGSPRCTASST